MAGRPTEENKNTTIVVRVPYRQYKTLKKQANTRDCTISEYIRRLIEKDIAENR